MERLTWDNEVARIVYEFAWILFPIGIIAMTFLLTKYIKTKKLLNSDLELEEAEKHNKIKNILFCVLLWQ